MKKILIIEDDKNMQIELVKLLSLAGYEALVLQDFSHSLEEIRKINPDLILLDIQIPEMNGELLLQSIRKESSVPVIMVTSRNNEMDEVLSISYGADDYIVKPYNPTILLLRISNIFKRMENPLNILTYDDIKVYPSKGILEKDGKILDLTKNEMIIFACLLHHRGNIVSRDELMTELWNNEEYINENALTVNISRLRAKLIEFGMEDAITTRKGQGYKLV